MRQCYFCDTTFDIEQHHVFGGPYRKKSTKYGYVRDICNKHHTGSNDSVHFNRAMNLTLKCECQREFEQTQSREEFIKEFGRSYL